MPGIAGISRVKQCSTCGAKVNPGRVAVIGGHRLAKDEVEGIGLRQSFGEILPSLATIATAGHAEFAFGNVPFLGRNDGNCEQRVFFGRGNSQTKSKARRQALRNVGPFFVGKTSPVDSAMILLVESLRTAGMRFKFVDALADLRKFFGPKFDKDISVERRPGFSAVVRTKRACGGYPHDEATFAKALNRVHHHAASSRIPLLARWMVT